MTEPTFEDRYLSGKELFGDDFDPQRIEEWFESEREGYANLASSESGGAEGEYGYHALNEWHGFRHLPKSRRFPKALGLGSAKGREFVPIASRIDEITILEPSDQLVASAIEGLTPEYVKPSANGDMPFDSNQFDLVLCFGTLHHIPNVTHVVGEIGRVVTHEGFALIREPIVSMGDWRTYRGSGCTENERGIPLDILLGTVRSAGLTIVHLSFCGFPVTLRMGRPLKSATYNSLAMTMVDAAASRLTRPLYTYHADSAWRKLRPTSAMIVATKTE